MFKTYSLYFLFLSILFFSCDSRYIYSDYEVLENAWAKGKPVKFSYLNDNYNDTVSLMFNLRNNNNYPFNNLYLFTYLKSPEGNIKADTLEYQMADKTGKWLGNGIAGAKKNLLIYKDSFALNELGKYEIVIYQGMRKDTLIGIDEFGIVFKNKK